jgi:hypothetical protein
MLGVDAMEITTVIAGEVIMIETKADEGVMRMEASHTPTIDVAVLGLIGSPGPCLPPTTIRGKTRREKRASELSLINSLRPPADSTIVHNQDITKE